MLLDQLTGCETILMFMLAKIFQQKYLCYFSWFSQSKNKKEETFVSIYSGSFPAHRPG